MSETYALSAEAAEFYESTFVPALFAAWAQRLVDAAAITSGQSVLDVACGTGVVARFAAGRVGPSGSVVGVDLNDAMLDVARRLRPDLDWRLGDACALPFDDGAFDVVLSQAGLMFFGDRTVALREMARVAGPDGRVVVQVPGRLSASPGYSALADVVARHAETSVVDLLGAYFAVGAPELLTELFRAAGLRIDRFDSWIGATRVGSLDTFLAAELLPIADRVDAAVRDRIVAECRAALAPFVGPDGSVTAPIEVHLIVGGRS
ncbi:methyltransferase domain-containing protein [Cryptosporangium aurantiacum]|uniref:Ubiquinone/menaquinone biosynthesis C-methylase UbiE n=1 Tax=Cryptosporangium aurantiacum TaxID=134849 RepID=A0A1M7RL29_9ACTN|nr:methyltransferase domain-containing protein [Cryptosporangium aurantiacum]SHN47023.1 Ubiquinone/menaquinone biosynthesis C-methylase UbiE [Cryptosporangium aurantiacum]